MIICNSSVFIVLCVVLGLPNAHLTNKMYIFLDVTDGKGFRVVSSLDIIYVSLYLR